MVVRVCVCNRKGAASRPGPLSRGEAVQNTFGYGFCRLHFIPLGLKHTQMHVSWKGPMLYKKLTTNVYKMN